MARAGGVALVVIVLAAIVTGAHVTERDAGSSIPDFPLTYGELWSSGSGEVTVAWRHRTAGLLAVAVALVVASMHSARGASRAARLATWVSVALLVGMAVMAARINPLPMRVGEAVVHAFFGWAVLATSAWSASVGGGAHDVSRRGVFLALVVGVDACVAAVGRNADVPGVATLGLVSSVLLLGFSRWCLGRRAAWLRRGYLGGVLALAVLRGVSDWTTMPVSPTLQVALSGLLLVTAVVFARRRRA